MRPARGRRAFGKPEQLDAQTARFATHRNSMDINGLAGRAGPEPLVAPLEREGTDRTTRASRDVTSQRAMSLAISSRGNPSLGH